jgi:signal transduction histidine kinase
MYTGSSSGHLYRLNLANSVYETICNFACSGRPPQISVEILNENKPDMNYIEAVIVSQTSSSFSTEELRRNAHHSKTVQSVLLLPINRGNECLGVLELESPQENYYTPQIERFASSIAAASLLLLEKKYTLDLHEALQQPVDFYQPFHSFLDDQILLSSDASGMPFIALREYDCETDTLECLALYGWGDSEKHSFSLHPVSEYPTFKHVVETGEAKIEADINKSYLDNFHRIADKVQSFAVVPVKVGTAIFGTLSFGCSCQYEYSPLEVAGFESIANGIGLAITNYRNFRNRATDIMDRIKTSTMLTAVEVAQAARHEARAHLDIAQHDLALMDILIEEPIRSNIQKLPPLIKNIGEKIRDIALSLDRIRDITKPPDRELKRRVINEIWKEAFETVQGRLDREHIRYNIVGPNVEAEVFPDFLMHAFLNLILNSIDAFVYAKKQNRQITIGIEAPSGAAQEIRMRYTDNASGIDPSKLTGPIIPDQEALVVEDIFKVGVTSKEKGSGFGLFLVRKIMDEHKGSINLVSHRGGVQFELRLPKQPKIEQLPSKQ